MLVLDRKPGETVIQDGIVTIHVLSVHGQRVKLGLEAPKEIKFKRGELDCGEGDGKEESGRTEP